jgi:hypothetical protein
MKIKTIVALLGGILLMGCVTPYQREGFRGGFSDTRLQENLFTVNFEGNGYCSRGRAQDFGMLRCAEVTLEHGFNFFAIADSSADEKTTLYHSGGSAQTYGTMSSSGNTASGTFNTYSSPGYTVPISMPCVSYMIFCFKEKPEGKQLIFDASFLANSVRQKYGIVASVETKIKTEEAPTSQSTVPAVSTVAPRK